MFFVTQVITTGRRTSIERNVRMGGYKSEKSAKSAAKTHRPAFVRSNGREIVGQTVNPNLPNYIT